ncbi:MAG: AAA family ATPase, partial [Ramlibacter sp.]|nr:AAA family ATPase [Ramlibacter sp.]
GNIRELRNVLEQAAMRSDSNHIGAADLEAVLRESGIEQIAPAAPAAAAALPQRRATDLRPLAEQVSEVERQAIAAALAHTRGNKFAAAKLLGISRAKLYERLEGLPVNQTIA